MAKGRHLANSFKELHNVFVCRIVVTGHGKAVGIDNKRAAVAELFVLDENGAADTFLSKEMGAFTVCNPRQVYSELTDLLTPGVHTTNVTGRDADLVQVLLVTIAWGHGWVEERCFHRLISHAVWKMTPKHEKQEFVTVLVRDPRIQKEDSWHSYIDYEIFIHTNSMCFTRKTSCVRRRFREFVWLRQRLQSNAVLIQLPELPSKTPFFSTNNPQHVNHRRQGLQAFLQKILQNPLLLSDSRLHLFVQTQLSPEDIEACVSGHTKYSVADAIHEFASLKRRFPVEHEERKKEENYADSDSESSSLGLGHSSDDSISQGCKGRSTVSEKS